METNKILISHVRDYAGQIHATLVALDKEHVGLSIRNPNDKFDRKLAITKAAGRAKSQTQNFEFTKIPSRKIIPEWADLQTGIGELALAEVINIEYLRLMQRAEKYFK